MEFLFQERPQWGWNWLEGWMATQQWQSSQDSTTLPPESSYATVAITADSMSEKTVEMDTGPSPTDLKRYPRRQSPRQEGNETSVGGQAVPSYMTATQAAKAKARGHAKGDGQSLTQTVARLRVQTRQHSAGHSPDSSCEGHDQAPPFRGRTVGRKSTRG